MPSPLPVLPKDKASTAEYITAYIAAGWSIIPIGALGKKPLLDSWKEFQTRRATLEEAQHWLAQWPDMNVGLVTGTISGIGVVDIDGDEGVASLKEHKASFPATLTQKTPHGWHGIFHLNGSAPPRNGAGVLPHIDIRGEGGYIVVAPSRLADGDYRWARRLALADFPKWIVEERAPENIVPTAKQAVGDAPPWVTDYLTNGAPEGQRDNVATRLAGYFHSRNIPDDIIFSILQPFASKCTPSFSERDLQIKIGSVSRYRVQASSLGIYDPPMFTETPDGYVFDWRNLDVKITMLTPVSDRLAITTEINITSSIPGMSGWLHGPSTLNLLSGVTRGSLAKTLASRLPDIDWQEVIENTARLAIAQYRTGRPIKLLKDSIKPPGDGWLIPPLIAADGPNLWFADGDSSKSLNALVAAESLSSGIDQGFGIQPTAQMTVAWLEWEWEDWAHYERLGMILGSERAQNSRILFCNCKGSTLADQVHSLRGQLAEHHVNFVVIDSVAAACGGEPEKAEIALKFFSALASLKVSSLLIAHTTKDGNEWKPFGSGFWFNEARNVWHIARDQKPSDDLRIGFYHRKNNRGPRHPPIGYLVTFANGQIIYNPLDKEEIPTTDNESASIAILILRQLDRGAQTSDHIAKEIRADLKQVRARLTELRKSGRVLNLQDGLWRLPSDRKE